jgi:hypothetical protein
VSDIVRPTLEPVAPQAEPVCPGNKAPKEAAAFSFSAGASGTNLKSVSVATGPCTAALTNGDWTVTCASVPATTTITLAASYGDNQDTCDPVTADVALTVTPETAVTATIAAGAADDVCPGAKGTAAFTVTTSAPVQAAPAVTLMSVSPGASPVALAPQPTCEVAGSGTAWSVACKELPAGTYALAVDVTSDLGECPVWLGLGGVGCTVWGRGVGGQTGRALVGCWGLACVRGRGALRAAVPLLTTLLPFPSPFPPPTGCVYPVAADTSSTASVATIPTPTFAQGAGPSAQAVCAGNTTSFTFPAGVSGTNLKGVTTNDTSLCAVEAKDDGSYSVTCAPVGVPGAGVALNASYGGADDTCYTSKDVALEVTLDPTITATIAAGAADDVCPGATGTATFTVTTSAPVQAAPAVTLMSVSPGASPVALAPQPTCEVAGSGTAWSVACKELPAGTYALAVDVTSDLGECAVWLGGGRVLGARLGGVGQGAKRGGRWRGVVCRCQRAEMLRLAPPCNRAGGSGRWGRAGPCGLPGWGESVACRDQAALNWLR